MAGSMRCFFKLNLGVLSRNVTRRINLNQTRMLFTEESLGMTAYHSLRKHYQQQLLNLEDAFKEKMRRFVDNEPTSMIFTEDLKVMLHLAEKTPEDIDILVKMVRKFNSQSSEMRFGTYHFGPVVMRSFYRLNEPDVALELFNDPKFFTFFNELSSYHVFLDLLYNNARYEDMRQIYNVITSKLTDGRAHPRNALILITAACYKENTKESLEYALTLWEDLRKRGYPTVRRVLTHLGALAINQGEPYIAQEILTTSRKPRYIGIRCLKVMTYADLDRVDDIVPFFRSSLNSDDPTVRAEMWFKDTISKVEDAIERTKTSPDAEVVQLLKLIKTKGLIQDQTIDDHINMKVTVLPPGERNRNKSNEANGALDRELSGPKFIRRPGLRDIA